MATCPRRMTELGPWERAEDLDSYVQGHGLIGIQHDNLSCSFCGSLSPDTFIQWIRDGARLVPSDKSYKCYVACPYPNERYGETKHEITEGGSRVTSVYGREAKFYFQHLSDDQRAEFVDLYNERKITFGEPGDFYRFPFFMAPVDHGEA